MKCSPYRVAGVGTSKSLPLILSQWTFLSVFQYLLHDPLISDFLPQSSYYNSNIFFTQKYCNIEIRKEHVIFRIIAIILMIFLVVSKIWLKLVRYMMGYFTFDVQRYSYPEISSVCQRPELD